MAVLQILLMRDGTLRVGGPIENRILCFGMLTMAEAVVHQFQPSQIAVPRIVPPHDLPGRG